MPPIIYPAIKDDRIVVNYRAVGIERPLEFAVSIFALELHTERMLRIFAWLPARATLNLQTAIDFSSRGRAIRVNQLHRSGPFPTNGTAFRMTVNSVHRAKEAVNA